MSSQAEPLKAITIFFCYAHEDGEVSRELEKHIRILQRQGSVLSWSEHDISAGQEWEHKMELFLASAHIILLLISPDFLASDYCYHIAMQQALDRHKTGTARVIPIIVRSVLWKDSPIGKLLPLPRHGKPISQWPDRDEAFVDIARGIERAIRELATSLPEVPILMQTRPQQPSTSPPACATLVSPTLLSSPQDLQRQRKHNLAFQKRFAWMTSTDETCVWIAHKHWSFLFPSLLLISACLLALGCDWELHYVLVPRLSGLVPFLAGVIVILLIQFLRRLVHQLHMFWWDAYFITTKRILVVRGISQRVHREISVEKIRQVGITYDSWWNILFHTGVVRLYLAGDDLILDQISEATTVKNKVRDLIHE